ncbi:FliA/WhiG family RNA polymerase sigma factor [Virgibacillus dakarensis]|uniref:RNA polymerase sigma-D factor n=1 Tax=Lentibacillus populi TaxID=1827502 RepID=A0A9W5X4A8_9BACI|nr:MULTISPECIES: FliA/WhiG family RNA polymerase sigma factor [Bacillaceae]MBT2216650.1 FliA/WhiG family RNA polymerase sigma factor [Virgibacillus dakarensis]MTW84957.1 FliA/WhiG family RNA polymerase sigma factor [Virgibacillus dakarensis]GGB30501.1 RNA polymerase sigma-D factor [Lentibacillus populi]
MTTKTSPLEQRLWESWLHDKDQEAANELIENYMYLVMFHVERISSHLPNNVSKDDIKSFGLIGLFDALNKFDSKRDLKFDTYASFRIRGAIIDGLRREDWLPRSIREKTKKIEKASQELEQQLQRSPNSEEIAVKVGMNREEVETLVRDTLFANVLSIEDKPKDMTNDHKEGIGYIIPDEASILPDEQMIKSELHLELAKGIKQLNDNEQMVISLFYHQELTLTEIGQVLGLTTSRISQIHRKAIFKLRNTLQKIHALA